VKLPRDVSGRELAAALARLDYRATHQTGSHIRLTRSVNGEQHLTIPAHASLRIGTLNAILRDVSRNTGLSRGELLRTLFG
jgi:predicted RNA binding protein YcfA (HicA-like mRNA interferase family)